jgi:hypothetical protein
MVNYFVSAKFSNKATVNVAIFDFVVAENEIVRNTPHYLFTWDDGSGSL